MTEAGHRNASVQVEIGLSVEIGQCCSTSAFDREFGKQRNRLQTRRDELLFLLEEFLVSEIEFRVLVGMDTPRNEIRYRVRSPFATGSE